MTAEHSYPSVLLNFNRDCEGIFWQVARAWIFSGEARHLHQSPSVALASRKGGRPDWGAASAGKHGVACRLFDSLFDHAEDRMALVVLRPDADDVALF